ncbi:SDR family oxidoreductase [Paenibacillus psychroresistens]|uniref:SDR family oxidoreductase n=1 Tax=Paenibacillus psychroresistens TaxID=1778678 RepID=A0A6B8RI72_9BACL|nr:SDR family oxidoreductase [Paenibacillus psychroresistens]QGQ95950.1 SDR family oxidoreductase [Paenibacillus psychroresistens]
MIGKVAIVTGGASGIGRGIVEVLLREGCKVMIADWNEQLGEQTVRELSVNEDHITFIRTDVSKADDIQNVIDRTLERWGVLDILVNNVGTHYYRNIENVTLDEWDKVIGTDLRGHFLFVQKVLPHMKAKRSGAIVNIASVHALQTAKLFTVYAAIKGGIVAMSRAMALECAPFGIRVNSVLPGMTRNNGVEERLNKLSPELRESKERDMAFNIPLGRIAEAVEIGEAVAFLASNRASFITGSSLVVDGGESSHL